MGIYKPLVKRSQAINTESTVDHSNDKLVTVPNAMTLARPLVAFGAAYFLVTGSARNVKGLIAGMAATDGEGSVGRIWDKVRPNSGRGTTLAGARWDPIADSIAVAEVSAAMLFAPKVTTIGKLAVGLVLGQEVRKTAWALRANSRYKKATGEDKLLLTPSIKGKESMVEKFAALEFAAATHDTTDRKQRFVLSALALGHAIVGSLRAETARKEYVPILEEMIAQGPVATAPNNAHNNYALAIQSGALDYLEVDPQDALHDPQPHQGRINTL